MSKRLLDMTPDELNATFDRLCGPDPLTVDCPRCGMNEGNFCETPGGRATVHKARRDAVGAP